MDCHGKWKGLQPSLQLLVLTNFDPDLSHLACWRDAGNGTRNDPILLVSFMGSLTPGFILRFPSY